MTVRHHLLEHIGTTAGSHLCRARRLADGAPVILKQLDPEHADTSHFARFRREYALLRSLDIAGVAKPADLVTEDGCLTMVLDDFAGESLEAVLDGGARMDWPACVDIARHLAHVLMAVHTARIIHQDIRPANILVEPASHRILLADFSLAASRDPAFSSDGDLLHRGDWAYLSPEQTGRMNRAVDYRTDFYSFGITLYRMLTGRLPFAADDPLEWTHCHIARIPKPPCDIAPGVPQMVSDIVMKLLAKLPEDRYQSMRGVQADLGRCLDQWQSSGHVASFPLGMEDVSDRFQIPHKLYGREEERAALLAAFDRMAASGRPALVTISGYSGIGKSALVGELHQPIVAKRGCFIAGKFDQYQHDIPYAIITQALRELVQQLLAESEAHIARWRQRIQEAVGVNGGLIVDLLPQVELIIGKQAPVPALPPDQAAYRFRTVFRQFIAVFARKEHPLVLFLDDLQWIDAASLKLIEHLLTHVHTRHLLLIAAYRDNEVSPAHPLMAALDAIRHSSASVDDIRLAPLPAMQLNRLVADTLHAQEAVCEPLTRLVFEKTGGNPFFFIQFLDSLHKEGLLQWNAQDRAWQWNLDKITAKDFADNVVGLMVGKLQRLPASARQALQLAACLGNKFDLHSLALVDRTAETQAMQSLSAAIQENLILCADGACKFLHDRIQQAAYSLIPEERRSEVHLCIGRAFMAGMSTDEMAEHVFDIANQLNQGTALLADREEKARVAELNLRAARKAKASAAYASACRYGAAGMHLLDESDWKNRYRLAFDLWLERANCEYLTGNFDTARQLIAVLLQKGISKTDLAAAYHLKILVHDIRSEHLQAVDSALACLRLFGIDIPLHPTDEQLRQEYETVWRNLDGRQIEQIIDLPLLADSDMQAAMEIFPVVHPSAFYTDVNLGCFLPCRTVNLSVKHGLTGACAHGCAWFGVFLGPVFHRYSEGYQFAKLACAIVEKHGFSAHKAKACFTMEMAALWTQPVATALDFARDAFRSGVESGDLSMACYSWIHILNDLRLRGDPLDALWRESEQGLDFMRKARFRELAELIVVRQHFTAALRGQTAAFSTLDDAQSDGGAVAGDAVDGAAFDEAAFEVQLSEGRAGIIICDYWILKLMARFMSGDYAAALAATGKAKAVLLAMSGHIQLLDYFYYAALTVAALYEKATAGEQREWRELLAAHQAQLREWEESYPPTFRDKRALVAAEIQRLEGQDLAAMRLYEEAIQAAYENGFVQNEAIACELAARFYFARGLATTGRAHLERSRNCYMYWGAEGKVQQLDEQYPELRAQAMRAPAAPASQAPQLDLLSVAKAAQAISGRIVPDELIDTLMHIMIENAGAQTGCLLLAHHDALVLAADAQVEQQTVRVRLHDGQTLPQAQLPMAILNYVRRSREHVLLMNAVEPHPFSADPYFAERHPKSVLCLPILQQSALIGVLYLENNLATQAFTPGQVKVLKLLASQAAVSLKNNAQLFAALQQENIERKRAEEAVRERNVRIRHLIESNLIGVFFWDLNGNITEANDAFLQMTGYSRQELLSGNIQWTSLTPPECRAADMKAIKELEQRGNVTPYEKEYIRKDGSRIPILIGAASFEKSQSTGVAFALDLTDRKQAEAERDARRSAEAANRAKSVFLAHMSHELRTPLNSILGYAQILEHDKTQDERQRTGLNVIRKSGEHLLTLINDILDFAKAEAGKMELSLADVQLVRFVNVIVEIVGVKAAQKGLDFVCDMTPEVPRCIRADEKRLRQVLLNLLSNAVKFTERGQVTLRVRFTPPARLRFEVQDTGAGIAAEQLKAIFQPFEQAGDAQRHSAGTGLGLAISRQYVRLMGSDIHVESRPGQGSTFWFELQVQVVEAATAPAAGSGEPQEAGAAPKPETAGSMVVPPMEEMEVLHRLARLGNMQNIQEHANHLAELDERYRPFAARLSLLAQGYQSKAILRLVEECMNEGQAR